MWAITPATLNITCVAASHKVGPTATYVCDRLVHSHCHCIEEEAMLKSSMLRCMNRNTLPEDLPTGIVNIHLLRKCTVRSQHTSREWLLLSQTAIACNSVILQAPIPAGHLFHMKQESPLLRCSGYGACCLVRNNPSLSLQSRRDVLDESCLSRIKASAIAGLQGTFIRTAEGRHCGSRQSNAYPSAPATLRVHSSQARAY